MNTNTKLRYFVELALLVGIVLLLNFTPLGFLKVGVIEITFIIIPIAVGAIILGPSAGAVLGGIFGLLSFSQCFGTSAFGVALFAISPIYTFIICFIPRVLMGWLAGLIFKALRGERTKVISYVAASLSCALLNTIFFVGSLMLLFGNTEFIQGIRGGASFLAFVAGFVGLNGLIEAVSCGILGGAISKALSLALKRRI